jgi:uncharacterized RDD family membrane protein YckC
MPPPAPVDPTDVTWKRIGAWLIDGVIYTILINVLNFALGTAPKSTSHNFGGDSLQAENFCSAWRETHSGFCTSSNGTATTITNYIGVIWVFLGLFVLYIVVQGLLGGSLGKLALGLRVVKADGSKAGIGPSAIRTVMWIVDAITCFLPVVGGIAMFVTKGHRRIGDMAAGTYVVNQHQVGHPVILPGQPGWGTYPPAQPGPGYGPPAGFGPPGGYPSPGQMPPANPWAGAPAPGQPAPGPTMPGAPAPAPTTPSATGATGDYEADVPSWDEARKTYIQYDSARQAWLEFDQASQQWKPIST